MVTLFFVLFRAPDLALTQMVVETVSVMLFLLCFYHLPKLKREKVSMSLKWKNLLISIGVGAVVTLIALAASAAEPSTPLRITSLKRATARPAVKYRQCHSGGLPRI